MNVQQVVEINWFLFDDDNFFCQTFFFFLENPIPKLNLIYFLIFF